MPDNDKTTRPSILTVGVFITIGALMSGCGSGDVEEAANNASPRSSAISKERLANGCFAITLDQQFLSVGSATGYQRQPIQEQATAFFLKPSGLDTYLLQDSAGQFPATSETSRDVQRITELSMDAEWRLHGDQAQGYRLQSTQTGHWLAGGVDDVAALSDVEGAAAAIDFVPASNCRPFTETTTNSQGTPVQGEFDDGSVWGIADVHIHLFSGHAFGGNVVAGDVFHPLGISHALADCDHAHGKGGRVDVTGYVTSSEKGYGDEANRLAQLSLKLLLGMPLHDTTGYPYFNEWPNSSNTTHQMAYYKWLERAYLGGLRLMVNMLVESGPLCKVGRELSRQYAPYDLNYAYDDDVVCNGTATSERQLQATYDLVDYIDAQHGGPGKGWLRIVTTPEQARAVIRDKKLAMIIGSETPDLFNCIDGVEGGRATCTPEYVDQKLDEYIAKGIRTLFPVHHYDNDFGGALVFNPVIEAAKVVQDGALFQYEACDTGDYQPLLAIKLPDLVYAQFPDFLKNLPFFPFVPEAEQYCNRKGITPLGEHLIHAMMKRGMLIETAHMSPRMREAVIAMAEQQDYPLIDSHMAKAFEQPEVDEESRYLALDSIRAPLLNRRIDIDAYAGVRNSCSSHTSQDLAIQLMAFHDTRKALGVHPGVVFGTDMHGMVQYSKPRFGDRALCDEPQTGAVTYPFTSFDGAVNFDRQVTGQRVFDFNTDGFAHIGMLPDLVQDMRNQGMNDQYMKAFYQGAEAYLQTWEKALRRSREL